MYKDIFDDKHRMIKFTSTIEDSDRWVQSGDYEGGILCNDCDNRIIGSFERYGSQLLFGGKIRVTQKDYREPDGLEFRHLIGIDYNKFKLFLLSILWRASVSSNDTFVQVSLGEKYEEKIRRILLSETQVAESDFPCVIISHRKENLPKEFVAEPRKIRMGIHTGYSFFIGGLLYMFKVSEGERDPFILEATVKENGEMKVLYTKRDLALRLLKSYFGVDWSEADKYKEL